MTGDERAAIRAAIDARKRETELRRDEQRCVGCGADYDSNTEGCKACSNRHLMRQAHIRAKARERRKERLKTDAAFRERERVRARLQKRKQWAQIRAAA